MCFDGTSPALYVSLIVCVISRNGGCVLDLAEAASGTGEPRPNGRVDCLDLLSLSTLRLSAPLLFCSSLFFFASARSSTVFKMSQLHPLNCSKTPTYMKIPLVLQIIANTREILRTIYTDIRMELQSINEATNSLWNATSRCHGTREYM